MKTSTTTNCPTKSPREEEEWLLQADGFVWDIVTQLYQLREQRGLSQSEIADRVGTKQQAISRLENPAYDRHSLKMLREVAKALCAFIDVVVVPEEKLNEYLECRYQPVLMDEPPSTTTYQPACTVQWSDEFPIQTMSIQETTRSKHTEYGTWRMNRPETNRKGFAPHAKPKELAA